MHSNSSSSRFTDGKELSQDLNAGSTSINEEEVLMIKTTLDEAICIINFLVQSNHSGDVVGIEVWKVRLRGMQGISYKLISLLVIYNNLWQNILILYDIIIYAVRAS